jgi:iron complex outermembrane receptor protein
MAIQGTTASRRIKRRPARRCGGAPLLFALFALCLMAVAPRAGAQSIGQLKQLSIEDLANIDVTSVTRSKEPLSDAPAAVFVITHDDIIRSGAMTLPEILRLAPNLEVAQINAYAYAISARGFNQYASNKLLIMIDGRAVYSPYFNGVFWDIQDVPPETIERIEVISGPGATLWGPNAFGGVINIITYNSRDTQGGILTAGGGNREGGGSAQYGGKVGNDLTYRVYGDGFDMFHDETGAGTNARDAWSREQGGFRFDWTPGADQFRFEGDLYNGMEQQTAIGSPDLLLQGENLSAQWLHPLGGDSVLRLLSYFSDDTRLTEGFGDRLYTYALELQHNFSLNSRNAMLWGIDYRLWQDNYANVPLASAPEVLYFSPGNRTINLADIYAQDTISLTDRIKLIPGMKLEAETPYTGIQPLPSIRLSWKPDDHDLIWSAISRAIRDPSREDRDLYGVVAGTIPFLAGGNFQPEKLTAFELGYRGQPDSRISYSISVYYNLYEDLRSLEPSPGAVLPYVFGNLMEGNGYGVEIWGNYQVTKWWRLSPGFFWEHQNLRFKPGSPPTAANEVSGDDPAQQFILRSSMNLTHAVLLDLDLREVGMLPDPHVPGYVDLDGRLAWNATRRLTLSLNLQNLLHNRHLEAISSSFPVPVEIGRTFFVQARWKF